MPGSSLESDFGSWVWRFDRGALIEQKFLVCLAFLVFGFMVSGFILNLNAQWSPKEEKEEKQYFPPPLKLCPGKPLTTFYARKAT